MFRIDTNKIWSGRYCTGDIVFVIVHSYEKKNFKNFKPSREKWISLKLHKPAKTTLFCRKAVEKTQNRQEGRHKTDFCETSLHKKNERPYQKKLMVF